MEQISTKTRKITTMGILLAMTVVLSFLEHLIPPLPPPFPPNVRFGLSNVIVMYTLFFLGTGSGYTMTIMKSVFVLLMRGVMAASLSLCGGLLSITVIFILSKIFKSNISYIVLSIAGAIAHNIGQMIAASLQLQVNMVKIYWPILVIFGIILGTVTGMLLKIVMPIFNRISGLESEKL